MDPADPLNADFALPEDMFVYFDGRTTAQCPNGYSSLPPGFGGRLYSPFSVSGPVPTLSTAPPVTAGGPLVGTHAHTATAGFLGGSYNCACGSTPAADYLANNNPSWTARCTTASTSW